MNKQNFILEDFNLDNLSGHAHTMYNESGISELEAIHQVCKAQSEIMPEHYKIVYDDREFLSRKGKDDSGKDFCDICFGFEVMTDE